MRPQFGFDVLLPTETVVQRIGMELSKAEWKDKGLFFGNYAELHIPKDELRYWSPHLSLSIEGDHQAAHIQGRLSPRQEIWTFVCVVYLALAFTGFFALMYSVSLWALGEFTWMGVVPPLCVLGIGLLYLISKVGQSWSSDQMQELLRDCDRLFESVIQLSELKPTDNSYRL